MNDTLSTEDSKKVMDFLRSLPPLELFKLLGMVSERPRKVEDYQVKFKERDDGR